VPQSALTGELQAWLGSLGVGRDQLKAALSKVDFANLTGLPAGLAGIFSNVLLLFVRRSWSWTRSGSRAGCRGSGRSAPRSSARPRRAWHRGVVRRFEYRVLQLRESLIGGKLSAEKLEEVLNGEAREGWMLKAITSAEVKGRVGPGGVQGLLLTFERPVA
jgi:hypothetical protein